MANNEPSIYYNRIYIKILDIKTGNDLTSVSTITVEYNGTTYNTSKSSNGSNVYDINGFPKLTTSVSVICHADCEGYAPSNVQCDTINNYNTTLTLTTLSLHKEYPKTIAGQIERINDAKADIKAAIIDKGGTVNDTDKLDSYSKIIDQITSRFNEYNYEYNGIADDDGLKAIGWNDIDIAYFKYNNLHPKSESVGDTYKVSDANKQIKITLINDISTHKDDTNFKYCPKFDTSNVANMYNMFQYCKSLISIPKFDTSKVTNMDHMFYNCTSLTSIPLFDTSKVTNMNNMFQDCTSLTSVPLFDTSKVTNISYMFGYCTSLTSVPLFDTSKVTNMSGMFHNCKSLTSIPLFDTSKVTNMNNMFQDCTSLTSVPLFDTSNVTDMSGMFGYCTSLTSVPLFDTSKVTNISYMFRGCEILTTIPLLDTSSVTNMNYMFCNCKSLTSVPLFDTSKVTNISYMFYSCTSLTSVPLFDTSKVTNISYMFYNCKSLTSVPLFDTSNVTNMSGMFHNCTSLTSVPLFDTSKVTNISYMFRGCSSLTTLGGFLNLKTSLDISKSPNLTHDSLMNVINKAADVTSSPKTLTLGSANLSKLTDAEKAIATNKGWVLK